MSPREQLAAGPYSFKALVADGLVNNDGSSLTNLPAANISGILTVSSVTATGIGVSAAQVQLANNVVISSAAAEQGGGVYVSSNLYIVGFSSATGGYYGDGSNLLKISSVAVGSVHDSAINGSISSSKLSGALPAISGALLTTLTAANLSGILTVSSVTATGIGVSAAQVRLADNVVISSAAAALGGGVYVSTHMYVTGQITASSATFTGIGVSAAQVRLADNVVISSAAAAQGGGVYISNNVYVAGNMGINTSVAPRATLDVVGTDAIVVPSGATGERPGTPAAGMIRYNSSTKGVEAYHGNSPAWSGMMTTIAVKTYCNPQGGCTGGNGDTYTPPVNLLYATVEVVGAGGGGGGAVALNASAGGGGGGGYARKTFAYSAIGTPLITVAAGGAQGPVNGATVAAQTPGSTSFGALLTATGGGGGSGCAAVNTARPGGAGGVGTLGDINLKGDAGDSGRASALPARIASGKGGASHMGGGGLGVANATGPGNTGGNYGGGGSGALGATANLGGAGAPGIVIITEFLAGP
ncbi:MAG TPA: hypothetical protein DCL44_12055 [Elusimicrobia bacterium]|nr:hypothetical protein [Elusimicrobiota bacterium]